MSGRTLAAVATPCGADEFIAAIQASDDSIGYAHACVLAAQSALETGRWVHMMNFNVGNFKATDDADHTYFATWERMSPQTARGYLMGSTVATPVTCDLEKCDKAGKVVVHFAPNHPACRFRAYDSLEEGVADYLSTTRSRWVAGWAAAEAGDPARFVQELATSGYFTANEADYEKAVVSLMHEFMKMRTA